MSLDPPKTDAELLALLERKQQKAARIERFGQLTTPDQREQHAALVADPPPPGVVKLRLPWSSLVSDNDRWAPAVRDGRAILLLTEDYRAGKKRIVAVSEAVMNGQPAIKTPLRFEALVWVPDNRRRDVVNFGKMVLDSLSGIVYADDSQLYDVRWLRAGVDVDAPRADITITPL